MEQAPQVLEQNSQSVNVDRKQRVFIMFQRNKNGEPKNKQYFDHIESKRIQMVIELFEKDPNDFKNRQIIIDHRTIDFKDKAIFVTTEPDNVHERFEFAEESTQKRYFRSDPSRFATNIATESLKHGNNGERNKLGEDWWKFKNDYTNPTLNQIREGIKKQEFVQLLKASHLDPSSDQFKEAYKGKCQAWDTYFDDITDTDHDKVLDSDELWNPEHSVPKLLNFLYTCDSWLPYELNFGSQEGDKDITDTLGAFARAFGQVICAAGKRRNDIKDLRILLEMKGTKLYRGTGLNKDELQMYAALVGKKEMRENSDGYMKQFPVLMALTGFISTSLNKTQAESFAWSNPELGKEATLFEIMWRECQDYFVMDKSAFPEEQEVLLYDGCKFEVMSVEQTTDKEGNPLNIIVLKGEEYDKNGKRYGF